jgi:hypothetical protein
MRYLWMTVDSDKKECVSRPVIVGVKTNDIVEARRMPALTHVASWYNGMAENSLIADRRRSVSGASPVFVLRTLPGFVSNRNTVYMSRI